MTDATSIFGIIGGYKCANNTNYLLRGSFASDDMKYIDIKVAPCL